MTSSATLPPGFRFHPTDDELVGYYLKKKVDGEKIELEVIPVIDLYKFDPWQLPDKSFLPNRDKEWFFFCPRDRKYPNGSRTNRATKSGYWKATGKDRKIICEPSVSALRKTLVFYRGRAPGGERTDWVMHEYRLCEDTSQGCFHFVGAFALCRVVKRNEQGQKTSEAQGEPRAKRTLSSATSEFGSSKDLSDFLSISEGRLSQATNSLAKSNKSTPVTSSDNERSETQPILSINNDQGSFFGTTGLSNVPKPVSLEEVFFPDVTLPNQFPNSTEVSFPCNLTPVSSYASLSEDSFVVDNLSDSGCMTSFPSPMHCMGLYNNQGHMSQYNFGWDSARYMNSPASGLEAWNPAVSSPIICRQVSEGEEINLLFQEDSLMAVM